MTVGFVLLTGLPSLPLVGDVPSPRETCQEWGVLRIGLYPLKGEERGNRKRDCVRGYQKGSLRLTCKVNQSTNQTMNK